VQRPDVLVQPRLPTWRLALRIRWPRPRLTLDLSLFLLSFGAYLVVASVLVFGHHSIIGDAWSRVANSYYVLFSRDPHLAAIGFVWNPLPSLAILPLLPFKAIWPALVSEGFAANILSAAFMAGAAFQLIGMLRDQRVPKVAALAISVAFAANPMIVLYGANGMSEAPFLFFLVMATRHLTRWIATNQVRALAYSGVALGFAYLTRYEAVAAVAFAAAVVAMVSYRRYRVDRLSGAVGDVLIVVLPAAFTFGLWATISWVIVGSPFETFSSVYGNSAQVARAAESISAATGGTIAERAQYAASQLTALASAMAVVASAAIVLAAVRRDARLAAPLAIFGGVVAFALAAFLSGTSFGWLRFYIGVIPLAMAVSGLGVASLVPGVSEDPRDWRRWPRRVAPYLASVAVLVAAVLAIPYTIDGMRDSSIGRGEAGEQLGALAGNDADVQYSADAYELAGNVASFVDSLSLPDGAVLADAAHAFPIILRSNNPRQFVITPDRDFERIMSDPYRFGVRYLLIPEGALSSDAVARGNPGITRDDLAELAARFERGGFGWRLYRLRG
jgi:hypothetical protein